MLVMALNGWRWLNWLEMAENGSIWLDWLEIDKNRSKRLDSAGRLEWLKMA